jgi:hypothetical protein
VERHFGGYVVERFHLEVRRSHPRLYRAEWMLNCLKAALYFPRSGGTSGRRALDQSKQIGAFPNGTGGRMEAGSTRASRSGIVATLEPRVANLGGSQTS